MSLFDNLKNPKNWLKIAAAVALIYVTGGTGWAQAGRMIGSNILIGVALDRKPKRPRLLREQSAMVRSAVAPQEILYGRDRKSGVIAYFGTSGTGNRFLWFVIAVAEHELDGYEKLWLDDVEIDIATEIDVDGYVTKSDFVNSDGTKLVKAKFYRGLDDQVYDWELQASLADWTTDHKGEGVAYFWVRLEIDDSKGGTDPENPTLNVWDKGYPRVIAVTARGKKVYDPRLDSTNGGTGAHRADTPSTWEWSDNPILCRVDYLRSERFGPGLSSSDIHWPTVIAQANIADQMVSLPGEESQKRYTMNGVVVVDSNPREIVQEMHTADFGVTLFPPEGVKPLVGAWEAPSHTIDSSWMAGDVGYISATEADGAYNAVRGQYLSAAENYTLVEFQPRVASAYETEDGSRVWQDIVLPFTRDEYAAQRLAIIELKRSRQQKRITLPLNFRGELVELYDTVTLALPLATGTFRVVGKSSSTEGVVTLELRQEAESDWTYTVPDLATPPIVPSVDRNPSGVAAPLGLEWLSGGFYVVRLRWENPNMAGVSHIEIWKSADNNRANAARIANVVGDTFEDTSGTGGYYWIIAKGYNGQFSAWHPVSATGGVEGFPIYPALSSQWEPTTYTGFSTEPEGFFWYNRTDSIVTMRWASDSPGETNGSNITLGTMPEAIRPSADRTVLLPVLVETDSFGMMKSLAQAVIKTTGVVELWNPVNVPDGSNTYPRWVQAQLSARDYSIATGANFSYTI